MKSIFKKTVLTALAVALVLAALPLTSVFAQGPNPPQGEVTNEKLEEIWSHQLERYERFGKAFDDVDAHVAKIQGFIDKAKAEGKDVTAVQAALDAYAAALKSAKPKYEGLNGIVNSHQGFDANGKVTDLEKAKSTVKEFAEQMKEVRDSMGGTFKALKEALKAFREANKPAAAPERGT
ncbi:MAG: hypothetical protein HYZ23_04295 [Chloroflexi bacterium]|nr:hypothetical protein [Chloroflexota bacterium]